MSDRTDFRLPGHKDPDDERKCILSLLAAYSKQWNPRNLEYPWYKLWGHIFAALVAKFPSYSVAPQPYLWYDSCLASRPYTTPHPDYLMATGGTQYNDIMDDAGNMDDIGNISLGSIGSISVPSHRDRARIPDFGITRKICSPLPDTKHFSHLSRHVAYVGFPLLAELKACGTRTDDIKASLMNAVKSMTLARNQLYLQASHLFQMYPHQDSVILVAITGFWWSYTIYSRRRAEELGHNVDMGDNGNDDDQNEEPDPSFDDQDGIHKPLGQAASSLDDETAKALQEQLRVYGFTLDKLGDTLDFHTVMPEGKAKLVEHVWSKYLLYGTPSSNQVLSLIHDYLRDVVRHFHWGERG